MTKILLSCWATYVYLGYLGIGVIACLWTRKRPAAPAVPPPAWADVRGTIHFSELARDSWRDIRGREAAYIGAPSRSAYTPCPPVPAPREGLSYSGMGLKAITLLGAPWEGGGPRRGR